MDKSELLDALRNMITDNKNELFDEVIEKRTRHLTIIIENMFQEQNASAVIRTADCLGLQDVHIIENNNKLKINPDISLGSSKWMSIHQYYKNENNTIDCIRQLKEQGYTIAATSPHKDDMLISELPVENKTALLFGTELTGLSQTAMNEADVYVKIPMFGFTESYNLSVSAGICMYDFIHRLKNSTVKWQLSESEKTDILYDWARKTIKRSDRVIENLLKDSK
ncbi:MAG: RNA methyltransferase [Crocinitomicaceae bacterium]|nr:RNA methyltransferase [Crocinitomicaceae bacterium]